MSNYTINNNFWRLNLKVIKTHNSNSTEDGKGFNATEVSSKLMQGLCIILGIIHVLIYIRC